MGAFDHKDMIEILELRCMCETYIFETLLAEKMLEDQDFAVLEKIIDEMVQVSRSPPSKRGSPGPWPFPQKTWSSTAISGKNRDGAGSARSSRTTTTGSGSP